MKIFILIIFLLSFNSYAYDLPKSCYGTYEGEMIKYRMHIKDLEISVDSHFVQIIIHPNQLYYNFGELKISGSYDIEKIDIRFYSIQANLTNNKNINFKLYLLLDKKLGLLHLKNHNQEPEVVLKRTHNIKKKYLRTLPS